MRAIIKTDALKITREVAAELVDHAVVIRHLKQIGKVEKADKWVPCDLTKNKKVFLLKKKKSDLLKKKKSIYSH